jgi:hypothetical protein
MTGERNGEQATSHRKSRCVDPGRDRVGESTLGCPTPHRRASVANRSTANADDANGASRRSLNTLESVDPAASAAARSAVGVPSVRGFGSWRDGASRSSRMGSMPHLRSTLPFGCALPTSSISHGHPVLSRITRRRVALRQSHDRLRSAERDRWLIDEHVPESLE